MTQKTPYEIRTELLSLAYNILRSKTEEVAIVDGTPVYNVVPFTTEDVVAEAEKLNKFVSMAPKGK